MGKRRAARAKKRLACTLHHAGKRHAGMVLDVSSLGLFVQTSASPDPGEPVSIELVLPGGSEALRLEGRAARRRVVPARLRAVAQGGVGVALSTAPEAWFGFMAELLGERPAAAAPAPRRKRPSPRRKPPAPPPRGPGPEAGAEPATGRRCRYRVRVKLGPRKQEIVVEAASETEARQRALAEAGAGWRVLRCERA